VVLIVFIAVDRNSWARGKVMRPKTLFALKELTGAEIVAFFVL